MIQARIQKKISGEVYKKIYNNQYLSMNDDINKLYTTINCLGGEPPPPCIRYLILFNDYYCISVSGIFVI